jgi:glycosyltransferase involved in cell wall biosynthesis
MDPYLIFSHEYPPFAGGVGNYTQGVAQAMHLANIPVTIVTTEYEGSTETPNPKNPPIIRIKTTKTTGIRKFCIELIQYIKLLQKNPTANIHAMDWQSWKIMSVINLLKRVPYSITLHGSEIRSTRNSLRTRLLGIKMPFRGVRHISVNSKDTRKKLLENFPFLQNDKIAIAYPAPQDELLRYIPKVPATKRQKNQIISLLTVGRIEPRKGHIQTLGVLNLLSKNIQISWKIIGEPIDQEYYKKLHIEAQKASFPIHFLGKIPAEELAHEYSSADIFVLTGIPHPTKTEGFGMVYLEAGLFSLPSVATETGGVAEAVIDLKSGLLSSPEDDEQLMNNLKRICNDTELRNQLGEGAHAHAVSFNWRATASKIFPEAAASFQ